jgi:hypothetical protein
MLQLSFVSLSTFANNSSTCITNSQHFFLISKHILNELRIYWGQIVQFFAVTML